MLGERIRRTEDARFLLGQGRYVADIKLPGLVHAVFLPSPHAHAVIKKIDVQAARALPGVLGVYSGADIAALVAQPIYVPGQDPEKDRFQVPVLAWEKVCYEGEPVAVVVATDPYLAEDALELIQVEYELLPAVTDAELALAPGTALLDPAQGSNLAARYVHSAGNVEVAFAQADRVLHLTYKQQRQTHAPMETCGCLAAWSAGQKTLDLYIATQHAYILRDVLAPILGLPVSRLHIITPDVGGSFGQKGILHREEVAVCVLARLLRRPIKWIQDRRANLTAAAQAREETCHVAAAVQKDGTLLAMKVRLYTNLGAYPCLPAPTHFFALLTASGMVGPWRFSNFAYEAYAVRTNKCPMSAFRAPMLAGNVVSENLMEVIAQELQLDPAAVRQRNIIRQDDLPYKSPNGITIDHVTVDATLDLALRHIDYASFRLRQTELRTQGRYLGIGIGNFIEMGAVPTAEYRISGARHIGWSSTTIQVEATGDIILRIGTSPHGQGHETTMAQLVAHELGVAHATIRVTYGDSARDPCGGGTSASQSMVIGGGATQRAAQQVRDKILRIAGALLGVSKTEVELRGDGRIGPRGRPEIETNLAHVAHCAYYDVDSLPAGEVPGLSGAGSYEPAQGSLYNGTHVCIVEVDVATGRVAIERYVAVSDCGRVINPLIVEGQLRGGIVQALGGVLFEHAAYDAAGHYLTSTLFSYLLPLATDAPTIEVVHLETPSPTLPYGAKPMAEGGTCAAAPALINAICDALSPWGVRTTHLPLSPARLRELIGSRPAVSQKE